MTFLRHALLSLLILGEMGQPLAARELRLASWNLEWLVSPASARAARNHCLQGETARLPCDVALDGARSSADFAMLAGYARQLDADVVAFQEVEDAETAAKVFSGYVFCLTGRGEAQNVGFAIRAGLAHRCAPDFLPLSLGDSLRRGAVVVLFPGTADEIHLLGVHLKSGCARDALPARSRACSALGRQLPLLGDWIRAATTAGQRFAVLGDFNRDLDPDLAAALPEVLDLVDAAQGTAFSNCYPGQTFTRYIDHILLGGELARNRVPGSFQRLHYLPRDARRYRLSDHCPISILLRTVVR